MIQKPTSRSKKIDIKEEVPKELLPLIRKILKVYGKDLRCVPLIRVLLKSMKDVNVDQITEALRIYENKAELLKEKLHPNYFIKVLESKKIPTHIEPITNVQWGKTV